MIEPLSKHDFDHLVYEIISGGTPSRAMCVALLDSHQYWRQAVRAFPETYKYVEDDDKWHGQEFCVCCGGEMANQHVNHKPDCRWKIAYE